MFLERNNLSGCTLVAKSHKKQKNRWNKHKVTTTYSYKRKSISQDIDAFLEEDVQIAANVQLLSNNHDPYDRQILICKPIRIKKGAWIGAGASVMAGVTMGKYAIVGAASVVTHDVGDYEVVVGSPAKVIKTLDPERFKDRKED